MVGQTGFSKEQHSFIRSAIRYSLSKLDAQREVETCENLADIALEYGDRAMLDRFEKKAQEWADTRNMLSIQIRRSIDLLNEVGGLPETWGDDPLFWPYDYPMPEFLFAS